MPTKSVFRRLPSAGIRVSVIWYLRPPTLKATVLLLVTLLMFPSHFALAVPSGKSARHSSITAPTGRPPEPFHVSVDSASVLALGSMALTATMRLLQIAEKPKLPEGFAAAKVPGIGERLISAFGSTLALATSTRPVTVSPAPPPTGTVLFDFDEDGKADIGRWQGSNTEFKVRNSGNGNYSTHTIGSSSSIVAPGDFDGDGKTDPAVFNAGTWTIKKSSNGSTQNISWGTTGDKPVAADYDGDGITDAAVFRPSTNVWWILKSSNWSSTSTSFGSSGDIPVTGNWDGDSYADIGVYRPSTGYWYVQRSTAGALSTGWGTGSDIPVPADFDGDGKTDLAVYRPSTGAWWIMKSSTGFDGTHFSHSWGNYGDQPVPADYDGDGKDDLAVWRPKTGVWYIAKSSSGFVQFEYHSLGVTGDTAVPSAYLKQVGATVYGDDMANARLSPKNATGGTNLYSRNFSWGTSLVSLPGRSGLDAGFGISYNSLVWTRLGSEIHFDVDQANVSPGFRIGFPTIEPVYYNDVTEKHSFLMVTPSGARVEFRQTIVTNAYETADSSYTQLKIDEGDTINTPIEEIDLTVTTTDGTQMTYDWLGGAYRCSQIKDRNGNYIAIEYGEDGNLQKVVDTLSRDITVNYDSARYPTSITQTWKDNNGAGTNTTHTWAAFTYTTTDGGSGSASALNTDFGSLTVFGPPNGTALKVLQKITYPDQSYTKFTYNNYAQVVKVQTYAPDNHELNRVRLSDIESVTGAQTDCPRFTETKSYAENFNSGSEVTFNNTAPASGSYSLPGSISGAASVVETWMMGHPDNLRTKTYFGSSGWNEGLLLASEDCLTTTSTCTTQKRWTWTDLTQDNTSLSYILNPRVTESRVGDGANTKKTTIEYRYDSGTASYLYGLPETITVGDLSTVLKSQVTTYHLTSDYTSRRIIELPSETKLYEGTTSGTLMSKVTFAYDENGYTGSGQSVSATRHDSSNYGESFQYRGNLTSARRWDATLPTTQTASDVTGVVYNIAGSPISQTDARGRVIRIGYTDTFNSSANPTTYAYPTVVTDAAGSTLGDTDHSWFIKYRYDTGSNVEAESPAPAGSSYGKKTKRTFDSTGRLERNALWIHDVNDWVEHSYVRYSRPTTDNGYQLYRHATVVDKDNDGPDANDEVTTETLLDGAGRVRMSRVPHSFNTNGATASWAATLTEYDVLGRVHRQSVPTESSSSWAASGDDASRGFLWTYQKYDWNNRIIRKINTDGIDHPTLNDSDVLISYEGCGCAGGQVTTIEGELVPRTDTTGNARRKQKIQADILGRQFKTETFNWDGTIYSTVVNTLNGRDQVTLSTTYAGTTSSSTNQVTTATFNGHGRMASSHRPEQRDSNNADAYTTYTYNADDSINTITDARGVVTTYTYENVSGVMKRPLVTGIGWTVPSGSAITDPADLTFSYDNAGNRTQMIDGMGTVEYAYNQLSQLTSETRDFTDNLADAPLINGNQLFRLSYKYSAGGRLKTYTDSYGKEISYTLDKLGRTIEITGTSFAGVTSYASDPAFRAWGGLKHLEYGNGFELDQTFNNRLQSESFKIDNPSDSANAIFDKTYQYYSDGRLKKVDENDNIFSVTLGGVTTTSAMYDRLFTYDHAGRIYQAKSSIEAQGQTETDLRKLPFRDTYSFNAFGNLTSSNAVRWITDYSGASYTFANNRVSNTGFSYDQDGRQTAAEQINFVFDAPGQMSKSFRTEGYEALLENGGDGNEAKRSIRFWDGGLESWGAWEIRYFIHSSVLGQVISEASSTGSKKRTYVLSGDSLIAIQGVSPTTPTDGVGWVYRDASGMSSRSRGTTTGSEHANDYEELDAFGTNVGHFAMPSFAGLPPKPGITGRNQAPFDYSDGDAGCQIDGITASCSMAYGMLDSGAGVQCPPGGCGARGATYTDSFGRQHRFVTSGFQAFADGTSRFGIPKGIQDRRRIDNRVASYSPGDIKIPEVFVEITDDSPYVVLASNRTNELPGGGTQINRGISRTTGGGTDRKLCNSIANDLSDFLRLFDQLWEDSQRAANGGNLREKLALIGVDMSGRVTAGRGRLNPVVKRYTGPSYEDTMGPEATAWLQATLNSPGSTAYLYFVHTHPLRGGVIPSGRERQSDGTETGDKIVARENGIDGILVVRGKLSVFNEVGAYCIFERTSTSLTYLPK